MSKLTSAAVAAPQGVSYPCLMRGTLTGTIYLMRNDADGIIIQAAGVLPVGHKRHDLQNLEPFYGVVTLTQE
jgi:hypothetical protein